ncbi:GNAT family N-acetyltransferase [Candidatus Daviesbacteria bacterium]|nr:GNAT family N-acetyltransferase [Candidatus Daviesbacteria bacterium]
MTETKVKPEEMSLSYQVKIIPRAGIADEQMGEFINFFEVGYGERWISEGHFRNVVMKNGTEMLTIREKGRLAAACNFDHHRITDIAVSPDFRGQGLGVRLFEEAARHDPRAWITIGVDAEAMQATVTDQRLKYLPVEDKDRIEDLFKECNGTRENYQVGIDRVELPLISQRLKRKGIKQKDFVVSYRNKSLHGQAYQQIIFQNQPQNLS